MLSFGRSRGKLQNCPFSTSASQRWLHKSHRGEEKASRGGSYKEGGGRPEEKGGAGEEEEGGRGEEERGWGEKESRGCRAGENRGEEGLADKVERSLLVYGGRSAEAHRGSDGLCAWDDHRPFHWPSLHRLAEPGDPGLQLQCLVCHGPPVFPLPQWERQPSVARHRFGGRPHLLSRRHHLPAAQAVCQRRRHHSKPQIILTMVHVAEDLMIQHACLIFFLSERQSDDKAELQGLGEIHGMVTWILWTRSVRMNSLKWPHSDLCLCSPGGHDLPPSVRLAVLPVWIQIHFQSQPSAEGEFTHVAFVVVRTQQS